MLTIFTGFIASTCANLQLVAQLRDYTETLEALIAQRTRQLQHSRDTLRIVFDNMRTGLVLLDSQEYLLAANSAFCHQIAGRDPRTLVGQEYALVWEQMVHDMHLQVEAEETLPTAMPAHTITIKRLLLTNQHAEKHRFEISREPIVDHSNTVVQYLEYWRNLTEPDTTEQTL
jgi:PAS domain-containing protein